MTPVGVTAAAGPGPQLWDRLAAAVDSGDIATVVGAFLGVIGAVVAALIAAGVAVRAYRAQQRTARRQERATFYAEAVRAVEDYMEAPYRILRKDGSHESRRVITQHISDVKSRIAFYTGWMAIHGTDQVRAAYDAYVTAAQREAGLQMTAAWHEKPVKRDKDVPIGTSLPRQATDTARAALLAALKADLDG